MRRTFDETETTTPQGFWKRQFAAQSTPAQDRFDRWFGVALPVACFVLDPLVFKATLFGEEGIYQDYRLFAYMVSAIEIGMFLCWHTFRGDLRTLAAPFAGVFLAGGIFSTVIGIAILPFSLIGLLWVIGIAGFTPFFTGFVYWRNGIRAMKAQLNNSAFDHRYLLAFLAGVVVIAFPLFWSLLLQDYFAWSFSVTC